MLLSLEAQTPDYICPLEMPQLPSKQADEWHDWAAINSTTAEGLVG